MKTIFRTILSGLALASLLVSCQKEMDTTTTVPVGEMVPVTFSAKVGAVTKVSLTPNGDDTAFTTAWEDGDGMKLSYENDNSQAGTVDATYDAVNSKWNATLPNYKGLWLYVANYPVASSIPFGSARVQTGNTYNSSYDIMRGEYDVLDGNAGKDDEGNDIVFPMERLTAIQYFHFTSDLDEKVYKATLSVGNTDSDIAATTVNISAGALVVATGGSKSITITFPDGLEPNANDFKLWFNVLPAAFETMTIDIETANHTKHIERTIEGGIGEYEAGKLYKVSGKITSWTTKVKGSEYTWTTASGDLGTSASPSTSVSKGSPSLTWSTAFTWKSSGYLGSDSRGIQIGSSSKPVKELVLSTSGYSQYVESIIINASRAGTAGPQISSVSVNGTNLMYDTGSGSETSVALTITATDYLFESPYLLKGDIVITFSNNADVATYFKSIVINPLPTVATPVITITSGTATITCATDGATIYYTLDGSTPTTSSTVYSTGVAVSAGATIKAIAAKDGYNNSTVASATNGAVYTFNTDAGIAALGISKPSSGNGTSLSTSTPYVVNGVSMEVTHGSTDTRVYNSSGTLDLRIYKSGGSLTFSVDGGKSISRIVMTGTTTNKFSYSGGAGTGSFSAGTWTAGATSVSSVTLTATDTGKINTITVIATE